MTVRSSEELCDMIKLFRVKELADLLSFAKLSKKGLKSELVKKCLQLPLDKEIRSKIESLAKERRKALYVGVSKQNVNSVDQIKSTPSKPTATSTGKIISTLQIWIAESFDFQKMYTIYFKIIYSLVSFIKISLISSGSEND